MVQEHPMDFIIVSVPHNKHLEICSFLSAKKIPILKEKPVADSFDEYSRLLALPVPVGITFQKRFEPRYLEIQKLLPQIGVIASFRAILAIAIEDLQSTWRATDHVGVTDDLGSHMLDIIVWLFGKPSTLAAQNVSAVRRDQTYGGDDVSEISMRFQGSKTIGHVHLSRVAHQEEESLVIIGTDGTLCLNGKSVTYDRHLCFGDWAAGNTSDFQSSVSNLKDTVEVMELVRSSIDMVTATGAEDVSLSKVSASLCNEHHVWPLLSKQSEDAVVKQMHSSLSIYDRSNIYEIFEDRWKKMHGLEHALVCSSGTVAIYHMFEALDLRPGDEVLCPVYTFFATATPMLQYGAIPIFCDALLDGNFDPAEILKKSTEKTKAVIVAHMWGLPCHMKEIVENSRKVNGSIKVFEDCSHAHGAMVQGKLVGSWGDMAAWSLQAKQNLTGGQAGIMATNSTDYYSRAIMHGHFNKRAKQEVPEEHPLRKFWLTGLGLNLRAHPLSVALANQQLSALPSYDTYRQEYALYIASRLNVIPFLEMPQIQNVRKNKHAWYAFVMKFVSDQAPSGLTRDNFVHRLTERGLKEVDIPRSTGLLNELPLFTHSHEVVPRFGDRPWHDIQPTSLFPVALAFYEAAIKLPMWTTAADARIVEFYVEHFPFAAEEALGRKLVPQQNVHRNSSTVQPPAPIQARL